MIIQELIIDTLRKANRDISISELVTNIGNVSIRPAKVKASVLSLIIRGQITFTDERKLRINE